MTTNLKYLWVSPRGFANEGTLYSYDPQSTEQVKEIEELKDRLSADPNAVVNENPGGVDYRDAMPWEVYTHSDRFKAAGAVGKFERL